MDIYFYEVKRVEETLPEKINIDKTPLDDPYEYVPETELICAEMLDVEGFDADNLVAQQIGQIQKRKLF